MLNSTRDDIVEDPTALRHDPCSRREQRGGTSPDRDWQGGEPSQGERLPGQRDRIVPDPTIGQLFPRTIFRGAFPARVDEAQ